MNRVLVVFSDGLLSELDSARGLVSRSAWIRQAVEDKLMKEAVAPLVPDDYVYDEIPIGGGVKEARLDARFIGRSIPTNAEFDAHKAEPKPKARRKKNVKDSPTASVGSLKAAQTASEKGTVHVVSPESPSFSPDRRNWLVNEEAQCPPTK